MSSSSSRRARSPRTKLLYSAVAVVLFAASVELLLVIAFYYRDSHGMLAIQRLQARLTRAYAERAAAAVLRQRPPDAWNHFWGPAGAAVRGLAKQQYEQSFHKLVDDTRRVDSTLLMLYVPSPGPEGMLSRRESRAYFSALAAKYGTTLIDVTDDMTVYPDTAWSLLPANGHLSRFGNQLIARRLDGVLEQVAHRSTHVTPNPPAAFGDLPPSSADIDNIDPAMVYVARINRQGLRNDRDVDPKKTRQRVLFLGDSFTYGPYLPNHDTFPELIAAASAGRRECLNAAKWGYSIPDEEGLFAERAYAADPDVTVLQVLDNDLFDLLALQRNQFDRRHAIVEPSPQERAFLASIDTRP